jgi:hypothetical protein
MDGQTEKFLLVIVILAVVLAPLREAFALTTVLSAGDRSHCTGMQHLMHSKMAAEGIWHSPGGCAGHCCSHGCDRTCCAGACVHAPVALTGATARVSDARGHDLHTVIPHHSPGPTSSPLFRPPIALPG